jgi:transposase
MQNLYDYFIKPSTKRQRQYEAVRAFIVDKLSAEQVASKYGYKISTVYTLVRDVKAGKLDLFPELKKGPKQRRLLVSYQQKIVHLRNKNYSVDNIHEELKKERILVSTRTIERILKENGFEKLPRRTDKERGVTKKNKYMPDKSSNLNFIGLKPFNVDCPVAGLFFFVPYIIESGIIDTVKKCSLPGSKIIGNTQASLAMLALKLIGNERLSQMDSYDHEPGLGIFAGLNVLPKSNYMSTYSCLSSEKMLMKFQEEIISGLVDKYSILYNGDFVNLDFHSIPHFGDKSEMEKVWCGSRNKALKGANTVFAQDAASNMILYTRADILRKEESEEIKKFVGHWKKVKGKVDETLVFDCKFTKYKILDELTDDNINFITLRQRGKGLVNKALSIAEDKWQKLTLDIPKRKHKKVLVFEDKVKLRSCSNEFRQVIIKGHGRKNPTFIITNNWNLTLYKILEVYAKRWRIENKLAELISFFNLNSLSSPLMIRIHFDILWTMIADTIYHLFAQDLRRFENIVASSIFKKFINIPGRVIYDGNKFVIKIRKRAYTPILKGVEKLSGPFIVPWLDNKSVQIIWTT